MEEVTAIDSSPPRHTVLVVDDDPLMAHLASEMLKLAGYSTLEAVSPEQALEVFEHNRERVDLLLSDVTMPGMNGRELGARLCEGKRDLAVVFMSGDDRIGDANLHKPFGIDELHLRVVEALQARHRAAQAGKVRGSPTDD